MNALKDLLPYQTDYQFKLDVQIQTLTVIHCPNCDETYVAGWPDWEIKDGKLISGSRPTEWALFFSYCVPCSDNYTLLKDRETPPQVLHRIFDFIGNIEQKKAIPIAFQCSLDLYKIDILLFRLSQEGLQGFQDDPPLDGFDIIVRFGSENIRVSLEDTCSDCDQAFRGCKC
ncbi:hypothetical protein BGZ63DRAFT_409681 [Mariannaea sp. PMI_226]|nr:hypothetical protein BGZ63DRAFT_409681 [Mariannaea sp. PMI_226]